MLEINWVQIEICSKHYCNIYCKYFIEKNERSINMYKKKLKVFLLIMALVVLATNNLHLTNWIPGDDIIEQTEGIRKGENLI